MMDVFSIDPERLKTFPNSFLEYFLKQESVCLVTKALIRDILAKRGEER